MSLTSVTYFRRTRRRRRLAQASEVSELELPHTHGDHGFSFVPHKSECVQSTMCFLHFSLLSASVLWNVNETDATKREMRDRLTIRVSVFLENSQLNIHKGHN